MDGAKYQKYQNIKCFEENTVSTKQSLNVLKLICMKFLKTR